MSGLRVQKAAVISEDVKAEAEAAYEIVESVQDELRSRGIPDYPQPTAVPPALSEIDLENLSNNALGALHVKYTGYAVFFNTELAKVKAREKVAKRNFQHITAQIKSQLIGRSVAKDEVASAVRTHPQYEKYETELLSLSIQKLIIESVYNAYRLQAQALSRNVELRKLEMEQQKRANSITSYRRPLPAIDGARAPVSGDAVKGQRFG